MTFTQLEYVVAVDNWRHFATAAENCYVTQPTLSMQIQKLEEELDLKIFDRSKQPVVPTEAGIEIIEQARKILTERTRLLETVQHKKGILMGELRIGIIPTLAPYLLPLFVQSFTKKYPSVRLVVHEMMTELIVQRLREGKIDAGILVTPLQETGLQEFVLFYEELMAYVSRKNAVYEKTYVLPQDIDPDKLWLLEEGHCFRSQIVNLCELKKISRETSRFDYEAGSIETLRRMVEVNDGITIIPELATLDMPARQTQLLRPFRKPAPMREVSLTVHRNFVKKKLIDALKQEILLTIPEKIRNNKTANIVPVVD
ncbi:MAG: transcriptional regulator [Sphingobacteriales bacterium SCN 48-20]|uniref:hydrogen peroxide-inducible genes activator n=1 Tax=Terrimonas ferruginea TaxID=249 RepID=UPI00086E851C|nr:hydrogen peroxide-inducible genes activator [Terrimonas ferruginea]MBN8783332.1 LysR family transcriptional regulator [Terrimonas ferruginea]ODT95166.1 MAG: transcriptional regulator [Sphingobacteriales bacterium SCN 48-20]OJW39948.1 MAG: hydrogen peroxide-inducible genes activator [Sphingobacteriales bacterium 48-107]